MAKPEEKLSEAALNSEAFEMIELAIGDLDTLTRAFQIIEEVCEERQSPCIVLSESVDKPVIN